MPEENQPLLENISRSGTPNGSLRPNTPRRMMSSSWGTILRVETIYKPKPVSALSPRKVGVMACILLTEMCERLSYYSVVANLILFSTSTLKFRTREAATISLLFSGTCYLMSVLWGYIADAHIGRFNAIFGAALINVVGLFLLPCSALDFQHFFGDDKYSVTVEWRRVFFFVGLALVSVGTGGVKANLGPLGAHEVQDLGPQAVQTFFNSYYWFGNAGAFIAFVGAASIQQFDGFAWGFLVPLFSMLLAIFIFLLSRENYRYRHMKGNMFVDSVAVCWQGCQKPSREGQGTKQIFDSARKECGGSFSDLTVDGVISIVRLLPVFVCVIVCFTVYSQMQSTFFIQGERMDIHAGSLQVPVASLNAFATVTLLVLVPLLNVVIYPCFQRLGHPLSHLHRIGMGFVLAALSMVAAALVEMHRKEQLGFQQTVGGETFFASNVTIFLQVPQYALLGSSETLTGISGLELAFTQCPADSKGLVMGLFLATVGLGHYLAATLLKIVDQATAEDPWFPEEINVGHAEYLFFLLSGLTALFFLGYLLTAKLFKQTPVEEGSVGASKDPSDRESSSSQQTCSQETSTYQEFASQKTRPQETNSKETSSQETSSQETSWYETSPRESSSHTTGFQEAGSLETSFQDIRFRETVSQETVSHEPGSREASTKETGSQRDQSKHIRDSFL